MIAAVIEKHGGPDVIEVKDMPEPAPGPGEVLVAVRAAAMNHLDLRVRRGGRAAMRFPHVLGSDAAGVVTAVGAGVDAALVGREVVVNPSLPCRTCESCRRGEHSECESFSIVGLGRPGTFASYVALPWQCVYPKPAHLDFAQAAALGLDHLTAWRMLYTRGRLAPGQTVLIHGIGGGLALAALQLARAGGAEVIVTSSSDDKLARAAAMGAKAGINYRTTADLPAAVRAAAGGRGVDLVIDSVGGATMPVNLQVVRKGGRIVLCGVTGGAACEVNLQQLYWNQVQILGSTMGSDEDFRRMLAAVSVARIAPVVDSIVPLAQVRAATERLEAGSQVGKIVLRIAP